MTEDGQQSAGSAADVGDENAASYDVTAKTYAGLTTLELPEFAILRHLRGRWDRASVLDLGVGAGRTAFTLTAVAGKYVGVDYSEEMVKLARKAIPEDDRTSFHFADARDLSFLGDQRFELVLFTAQGFDMVGHEDRPKILAEMRRHTADDGICAVSSHSLRSVPLEAPKMHWPSRWTSLVAIAEALGSVQRRWRVRKINRSIDLPAARQRGWVQFVDEDPNYLTYYVDPETQVQQLEEAGFELVEILDFGGQAVSPSAPRSDVWLHYVCRPRTSA